MMDADDLIDRNRRLLAIAAETRGLSRQVVGMSAASRSMLNDTAWHWVELQRTRYGLLADMVYLRHAIADLTYHPDAAAIVQRSGRRGP